MSQIQIRKYLVECLYIAIHFFEWQNKYIEKKEGINPTKNRAHSQTDTRSAKKQKEKQIG